MKGKEKEAHIYQRRFFNKTLMYFTNKYNTILGSKGVMPYE
jgi:hypothetical protein